MTAVRAIVIGMAATITLAVIAVVGLRLFTAGGGDVVPIWERAVWDGTGFVINDPPDHWTSPDGIEWTRQPGLVLGAGDNPCHPDFPCDLQPEVILEVPMLYAAPQTWVITGRDDIALANVMVRYDVVDHVNVEREGSPLESARLHPAILARAARQSECFARLRQAGAGSNPDAAPDPDDAHLVGYGGGHAGDEWQFTATCRMDGQEDRFSIDLAAELDPDELRLLEAGGEPELWVVRTDGARDRVTNPPLMTYGDGLDGEPTPGLAPIEATPSRFWAVGDDGVVTSENGFDWEPPSIDTGAWAVIAATTSLGGDVALHLVGGEDSIERRTNAVLVSHDDGRTWGDVVPLDATGPSVYVTSVGPAGVAIGIDAPGGEREVFIDDRTGDPVFSARSPIGNDALIVGSETVLMPRERIAANGDGLGPVLDVYDTTGELITTVFPD